MTKVRILCFRKVCFSNLNTIFVSLRLGTFITVIKAKELIMKLINASIDRAQDFFFKFRSIIALGRQSGGKKFGNVRSDMSLND